MHKLFYWLLSSCLCFAIIPVLMDFTIQATNTIFWKGGSVGVMEYYGNSSFHLGDYSHSCDDMWSCARVMQNLYEKHNKTGFMSIFINPFPDNITEQIYESPTYYIPFYSIIFSMVSLGFSIILGFLISIGYLCNENRRMFSINFEGEVRDPWTINKKVLYGILFFLRIPVYISIILIYAYLIPKLMPFSGVPYNIKVNEYVRVFTLLLMYIVDNFLFPYEMLN